MTASESSDPEDDTPLPYRFPVLDRLTYFLRRWMVTLWVAVAALMAPADSYLVAMLLLPTFLVELRWVSRAHDLRVRNAELLAVLDDREMSNPTKPILPSRRQALWFGAVLVGLFIVASLGQVFMETENGGYGVQYALMVLPYIFTGLTISRYIMDITCKGRYMSMKIVRGTPTESDVSVLYFYFPIMFLLNKERRAACEITISIITGNFFLFHTLVITLITEWSASQFIYAYIIIFFFCFIIGCTMIAMTNWVTLRDRVLIADSKK